MWVQTRDSPRTESPSRITKAGTAPASTETTSFIPISDHDPTGIQFPPCKVISLGLGGVRVADRTLPTPQTTPRPEATPAAQRLAAFSRLARESRDGFGRESSSRVRSPLRNSGSGSD